MRNKDDTADLALANFSVDAALIRELGESLIGRAYIALGELVKNSFDADAHTCQIDFENDSIIVSDDGHGISEEEFHHYWMRLGTTHKVGKRRSRHLNRPMTGSKGLGRLSVQFLAQEMELESNCPANPSEMLYVFVDWQNIRSGEELEKVDVGWECRSESTSYADDSPTGTRIVLKGLKTIWDEDAIEALGRDVWLLRSPFRDKPRTTSSKTASDFFIELNAPDIENAKQRFDIFQNALLKNWKARITGTLRGARHERRGRNATYTVEFTKDYPKGAKKSRTFKETVNFPIAQQQEKNNDDSPSETGVVENEESSDAIAEVKQDTATPMLDSARFTILVFKPEGRQPDGLTVKEVREYLRTHGNVSVYDAGFRLPYYGSKDLSGDDWLRIGEDQGRRLMVSLLLPHRLRIEGRYLLDLPNPGRIFGAVEIDTNHERKVASLKTSDEQWLQIQPGRDRLAPNLPFFQLRNFVRLGLDLYANRYRALSEEVAQTKNTKEPPSRVLDTALETLTQNRPEIPHSVYSSVRKDLVAAQKAVAAESRTIESQAALLAPLATAGMAALALNHELSNDADLLVDIQNKLNTLSDFVDSPLLSSAMKALKQYQTHISAYELLFAPLAESEDRAALNKLPVKSVVDQVVSALKPRLSRLSFDSNHVSPNVLFPVGAFVEWSAILQNILFNAWNAMLEADSCVVRFDTSLTNARRECLRVSDTGIGLTIPIQESSVLFEPFERRLSISPAIQSMSIGGQGLGLAIVRMIARSRNVEVKFVKPPKGFSTSIELSWKNQE